ncbi:hypothetical protein HMPREF0531_12311, partial [Lactiplantibacillus plantarum subsp. plantarum ATCC 14917 = JCM 1149 = CGMCC 1.2437]
LRITWLLSIVTQPLQSQACERPRVEAEHCLATTGFSGTELSTIYRCLF